MAHTNPSDFDLEDAENDLRPSVPQLDEILGREFPVLDHGFVRVVDYMGDDGAVVQAARVSYGKGTKKRSQDRGLIRYLLRHRHTTPFEMCEIKFHVKLPIFVARQWIRHRTASVNEYSARYSVLEKEFYLPGRPHIAKQGSKSGQAGIREVRRRKGQKDLFTPDSIAPQSAENKQGREGIATKAEFEEASKNIHALSQRAYTAYQNLLNEDDSGNKVDPDRTGLARELARTVLPVNFYTQWYWKTNLHNLLHFLSLRADAHAQYEIRVYAEAMLDILERWTPLTYEAFMDYRIDAVGLSSKGLAVVKRLIAGEQVSQEDSGLPKREWRELMADLGREG